MQMIAVNSSVVKRVGYRASTRTMQIMFPNRSVKTYWNISPDFWRDLMNAKSKGRFFNSWRKQNRAQKKTSRQVA